MTSAKSKAAKVNVKSAKSKSARKNQCQDEEDGESVAGSEKDVDDAVSAGAGGSEDGSEASSKVVLKS